ncbi:YlxR family protein [Nitratidesulfovibrio sp. HK-II]|uniref:YlxR family protein n=1 Tax=Nitratidesulfovibrio sp. HK-II TaxID=2009266 RepID=UPI003B42E6DA
MRPPTRTATRRRPGTRAKEPKPKRRNSTRMDDAIRGKHIPLRTCVICRRRFAKRELLRYVPPTDAAGAGATPVPDERQVLPGRGFYVCDSPECRERFRKFGGWRRKRKGVQE